MLPALPYALAVQYPTNHVRPKYFGGRLRLYFGRSSCGAAAEMPRADESSTELLRPISRDGAAPSRASGGGLGGGGAAIARAAACGGDSAGTAVPLRSFAAMSICFSLNHGCTTALIPLASVEFGTQLGGDSLGVLYILYTLTAMSCATVLVGGLGPKWSLVAGLAAFCVYVASYLVAYAVPSLMWTAAMFGASIGGFAAGSLWTAQGSYFTACAVAYAESVIDVTISKTRQLLGESLIIRLFAWMKS